MNDMYDELEELAGDDDLNDLVAPRAGDDNLEILDEFGGDSTDLATDVDEWQDERLSEWLSSENRRIDASADLPRAQADRSEPNAAPEHTASLATVHEAPLEMVYEESSPPAARPPDEEKHDTKPHPQHALPRPPSPQPPPRSR